MYILFFLYLIILNIYFRSSIKQTYCKQILNYVLDVIKGFKYDFSFCFLFYLFSSSSLLIPDHLGPHHTIIKKYNQVNNNNLHYFSVSSELYIDRSLRWERMRAIGADDPYDHDHHWLQSVFCIRFAHHSFIPSTIALGQSTNLPTTNTTIIDCSLVPL